MKDIYEENINKNIINDISDEFNIDLAKYKVYNQKESMTCWIYASINLIKRELAEKLKIAEENLDFSISYISFFDRFEKLNKLYDEIIQKEYESNNIKYLLFDYINPYGSFAAFKYLVNKYGMVSEKQMPSNSNFFIPNDINELLKEKIIFDIELILKAKANMTKDELFKMKEKFLKEDYKILEKIYGVPPKNIILTGMKVLPIIEFKDKYVSETLNQYVNIVSLNNYAYHKEYNMSFNVPNMKVTKYLNLELSEIKRAIYKSLQAGYPVWFGCSYRFMSGSVKNKVGILDSNLYEFERIGIEKLSKNLALKYNFLNYDHAMIFTGVNEKLKTWKALNTFGEENNREGYFIINENFFDENIFLFAIKKEYLENLELSN